MSCQPYLQWWISPLAHLLLKTDRFVSVPLFLFFLPALLILPLLSCSLASFITEHFICLLHLPCSCCCTGDFSLYILSSHFSLQFSVPFSRLQSWMTHVYDPYKGTHLFSARPTLSVSLLLVFSLPCSTCLHTSAANPPQTVFCPFNIPHRWKGHGKL